MHRSETEPVVLIPALLTTSSSFAAVLPWLAARRVITLDLPGHGGCAGAARDLSLADLSSAVLSAMTRLGIERAVLGGLSLGGLVALRAASVRPERVSGLLLMGTPCTPETPESRARRLGTYDAMERLGVTPVLRAMAAWMFARATRRDAPEVVEQWLATMRYASPAEVRRTAIAALDRGDSRDLARGVRAPALVVSAAEDVVVPPSEGEALALSLAHAHRAVVEGAGHVMTLERGAEVGRLIARWLGSQAAAAHRPGEPNAVIH